jgi:DHA2 family methylenomycin A resistance protein-like MFS transporter
MAIATRSSKRVVLGAMCVGYFLVLLDVTIVNVALPAIREGLGASVAGLQWVVDGYAVTLASLMLAAGALGDVRGHRRIVLAGLALFGLASVGCGAAPGTASLAGARVAQGAAAAMLLPGTLAIIADTFPDPGEQARAIGIWAGIGGIALPAGPLLGGALVEAFGWRSVFLANVPVVAVTLLVALRVTPAGRVDRQRSVDVTGSLVGAAALALIVLACIEAGSTQVSVPAGVLAVSLVLLFVRVERRSDDPALPLALFARRRFSVANGTAAVMNLCTLGMLFVLTLYLQDVRGLTPFEAGLELVPLFLPLVLIAPLAGRATAAWGPRRPMIGGLVIAAAGLLLLSIADKSTGYATLFPSLLLWGSGLGVLTPAVVAAAVGAVGMDRRGVAAAVNNTARQAGGAIGIAVFGSIAGSPGSRSFVSGLHAGAVAAGVLYLAVAAVIAAMLRPT